MTIGSTPKPARILVVDDIAENIRMLRSVLKTEPYPIQVIAAQSGVEALTLLETEAIDLILLDVMMPGMDGYEVTSRIRANPHLPFIPILLLTAHHQADMVRGLDTGADDFIRKPVSWDEMLARIRALLRLKRTVDEREQIAHQQKVFASLLTHDLQTPLIATGHILELIQKGRIGHSLDQITPYLGRIAVSMNTALSLIDQMLQVYRYELGQPLHLVPVKLTEVLQEAVTTLIPLVDRKGLQLTMNLSPQIVMVLGDALQLNRLLTNLLSNAIKFTETGGVTVGLQTTSRDITITVTDTGSGIHPDDLPRLFELFRRGKPNNHQPGSGLGLYLAHHIVKAHHGTLTVTSQLHQGSTFTVTLPVPVDIR